MKPSQVKLQIGKKGLTNEFIDGVKNAFKTRKQVRISVLKTASQNKSEIKEMAEKIVSEIDAEFRIIGHTIILIRQKLYKA